MQRAEAQVTHTPGGPRPLKVGLQGQMGAGFRSFFERLQALKEGRAHRARISVWGDSHVAGEVLVHRLRRNFQKLLGDAGPGFVLLGRPWPSYVNLKVKLKGRSWRAERLWSRYTRRRREPRDDLFGVGGVSVHTKRSARTRVSTRSWKDSLAAMDLYYLGQPGGGRLVVTAGRKRVRWVMTVASKKEPGFARIELPKRTRSLELLSGSHGEVRLYGADLESGKPGVVVDTFGINGARASVFLKWNETFMKAQLARLAPDLVVLAYGSNEVDGETMTKKSFSQSFDEVLQRVRRMTPNAACLVVGPPDQGRYSKESGAWEIPGRLDTIVTEQRRLAARRGCAFWDQRAAMGGRGSIFTWVSSDPPMARGDHVHLRPAGYRRIADALFDSIIEGWTRHRCGKNPGLPECDSAGDAVSYR